MKSKIVESDNEVKHSSKDDEGVSKFMLFLACSYLFLYYTRIQDNIPGLNSVPWVGGLFLLFTLCGAMQLLTVKGKFFSKPIGLIFWLGLLFGLTGIDAISPVSYKMSLKWVFQTFLQAIALVMAFSSLKNLRLLHNLWCFIYFFMALFTIKNAPYGAGDFTTDPNDACLALGMGIPFAYYSVFQRGLGKKYRSFCLLIIALLLFGIIATGSRGGFLGLVTGLLAIWWMSSVRIKVLLYSILASALIGSILLSYIPEDYVDDMKTISDTEDDTRVERLRTWEIAWVMFKDNPIIGVGAGNFSNTSHLYQRQTSWWTGAEKSLSGRSAHSLHFQVLSELGLTGTLIYCFIMFILPLRLLKISNRLDCKSDKEYQIKLFCQALIASMGVYVIAGTFISVAYYPHIPIWLAMYTIVLIVIKKHVPREL